MESGKAALGHDVDVLDDPRMADDPEALKAELVAEIKALHSQRKRVIRLGKELRAKHRALKQALEEMESMGLIEWPEDIPRPVID